MSATRVVHVNERIEGAVYIGRANGRAKVKASPLANPYPVTRELPRQLAIARYATWLVAQIDAGNSVVIEALIACRNRPVACWCRGEFQEWSTETACHGDAIVAYLARYSDDELRSAV